MRARWMALALMLALLADRFDSVATLRALKRGDAGSAVNEFTTDGTAVVEAVDPPSVDMFNFNAGSQQIAGQYKFTDEAIMLEAARVMYNAGATVFKLSLSPAYTKHLGVPKDDSITSMLDLATRQPSFRSTLDIPFAFTLMWCYPLFHKGANPFQDGMSQEELAADYREMYDLARHLLTTYSNTGRTFLLGHWEGDWMLLGNRNKVDAPSDQAVQGMIDWLNNRQRAVDDAKAAGAWEGVRVAHYAEVNLVQKAVADPRAVTVTTHVLPFVDVDYVSFSAYSSLGGRMTWNTNPAGGINVTMLHQGLDFIESRMRPKAGLEPLGVFTKRVWIGEYAFPAGPAGSNSDASQVARVRQTLQASLTWGCPFTLYWEVYDNELWPEGYKGNWLIDHKGEEKPVYRLHTQYYERMRTWLSIIQLRQHRAPSQREFVKEAVAVLEELPW